MPVPDSCGQDAASDMRGRFGTDPTLFSSYHSARRSRLSRSICLLGQSQSGGNGTPCFFISEATVHIAASSVFFSLHHPARYFRPPRRIPHLRSQGANRDGKPCFPRSESTTLVSGDRTVIRESVRRSPVSVRAAERASPCRRFPFFPAIRLRAEKAETKNDIYSLKAALPTGGTRIFKYLGFCFERPFRRTGPDIQCQR